MFEGENFLTNEYDSDDDEQSSISTIDSYSRKKIVPKVVDRGCHKMIQKRNGVLFPIKFYTTRYTPGSRIRNAVTGFFEEKMVGRIDEFNYFKVTLSGQLGQNPSSKHLYYDSPQQYEVHFQTIVDDEMKDKFNKKFLSLNV